MRLLLAEDDPLLGDGLRAGLKALGFQVDWVRDGVAAERELLNQTYTAAILDLGLPRVDGMDVLHNLRHPRCGDTVLAATARDAVPQRIQALDLAPTTTWSNPSISMNWPPAYGRWCAAPTVRRRTA